IPQFYTLISEVDYNYSVIDADSLVVLGLDNFLGAEHPFYQGLPTYIKQTMEPSQLMVKVAAAIGRKAIEQRSATYLLDHMIAQGMVLHTQTLLWPEQNIQAHLGYNANQWDWIQQHEADLWRIFLDKAWLYATDQSLRINLLMPGPFSKFGLDMDREIPPMVGKYFGWKIVSSYAENHPDLSLEAMLAMDARSLFESSGYKPAKSK
ncbi:MAG: gliding motility lipoprotein GldB, partial [Flavobacteriaceae bacterium]